VGIKNEMTNIQAEKHILGALFGPAEITQLTFGRPLSKESR